MLTVACVLVTANVAFDDQYVLRLRNMVRRHLQRPHRFVCLTHWESFLKSDRIEVIPIPTPQPGTPGWWSKLELFNPKHDLGNTLYLDLDVLIVKDLDPIVDFSFEKMALIPTAGTFEGRGALKVVKEYNSSVMRFYSGRVDELYTDWDPSVMTRLWGDQDWIGEKMPDLTKFPLEWFPRLSEVGIPPVWPRGTKVVLCKKPKNHEVAEQWPWFNRLWGL